MITGREGYAEDRRLWEQIYAIIWERIDSGEYPERKALPGIYHLADSLDVSHATVRKVIRKLAEQNVLNPISGKGTFVRPRSEWRA